MTFDKVGQWHSAIGKDRKHEGFAQTYYSNELQNSKNRNRLFRVYDKILDSFRKGKTWLFPHLSGQADVRRVELELRPDYCQRLCNPYGADTSLPYVKHVLDLVDDHSVLEAVFKSNLADYCSAPLGKVYLKPYVQADARLDDAFLQLGHLPNLYVSRASGYLRKSREAG